MSQNQDKKERFSAPARGGISLLVAFAVLCLTVFALLGLSTVRSDDRLADAAIGSIAEYYAADCDAQEILARLRAGELPEGVSVDGNLYFYSCPISDTRKLEAEVIIDGTAFTILRWQAVPATPWEADETLDLWDGSGTTF